MPVMLLHLKVTQRYLTGFGKPILSRDAIDIPIVKITRAVLVVYPAIFNGIREDHPIP